MGKKKLIKNSAKRKGFSLWKNTEEPKAVDFLFGDEDERNEKITNELEKRWKKLSEKNKIKWARQEQEKQDSESEFSDDEEEEEEEEELVVEKKKKKRTTRKRKRKDPNAPKKPIGSFFRYCKDFRRIVREANPGIDNMAVSKKLGILWGELDKAKKLKYHEEYQKDKVIWLKVYAEYQKNRLSDDEEVPKKKNVTRGEKAPKKPGSPYLIYSHKNIKSFKSKYPGLSRAALTKRIKQKWEHLSDVKKEPYNKEWQKQLSNYKISYRAWLKRTGDSGDEAPQRKRQTTKKRRKKDPNAPKGAKTAYIFFFMETRKIVQVQKPGLSPQVMIKEVSALWADTKDRSKWDALAKIDKERYRIAMDKYNKEKEKTIAKKLKEGEMREKIKEEEIKKTTTTTTTSGSKAKSKPKVESESESEEEAPEQGVKKDIEERVGRISDDSDSETEESDESDSSEESGSDSD